MPRVSGPGRGWAGQRQSLASSEDYDQGCEDAHQPYPYPYPLPLT